jgi:peptidyl-prolyl cis-trans isomerase C
MKSGIVLLGACFLACGGDGATPETRRSSLPAGAVAKIGSELVRVETIARIARAQNLAFDAALEKAISDAAFALGARSSLSRAAVTGAERAALARSLLSALADQARASGPPSEDEVARLSAERWVEFDRPEAARTTHAVVLTQKPDEQHAARELAVKIAEAVRRAGDAREFSQLARAVPPGALTVTVQPLAPVTLDGRTFQVEGAPEPTSGTFDPDYARAALALERPGQISPIVKSKFGYHVIFLEERLGPKFVPFDERRRALAGEVELHRADAARRELIAKVTASTPVELSRSVDELTAIVSVSP